MTDPDYTHLALIVDRSGSMQAIQSDMNGAIVSLLEGQKAVPGHLSIDITVFDSVVEFVGRDLTIDGALELCPLVVPRGMTALWDAIGMTVTNLGAHLAKMDEVGRPGKVLVVIVTDGLENSSREWRLHAITELITQQREKYQWEFVYLGANQDAIAVAGEMGMGRGSTLTYAPTSAGVAGATTSLASATTRYRTAGPGGQSITFTDDEREAAADA